MVLLINQKELVVIDILYYRPDYHSLLQSFIWQLEDEIPDIPRVHQFLDYWRREIEAPIKEVIVSAAPSNKYRSASFFKVLQ